MRVELICIFERNWNLMPDWIHDSIFNPTKGTVGEILVYEKIYERNLKRNERIQKVKTMGSGG